MPEPPILHHTVEGAGEPLLLMNGIAMSAASWDAIAAPLAERFRVVRFDFRGQLMSPGEAHRDISDHAADVATLLDHLGLDRVHVLATSFGAAIGTLFAARYPDRLRSLISVASADAFDDVMADEVARWRAACVASVEGEDRGLVNDALRDTVYSPAFLEANRELLEERRRLIGLLPDAWFHGLIGLLDSTDSVGLAGMLGAIRCPSLIVAAELDGFIPLDRTRALADGIPGARFVIMEGAGHAVVVEQPEKLVGICLDFLQEVGGGRVGV